MSVFIHISKLPDSPTPGKLNMSDSLMVVTGEERDKRTDSLDSLESGHKTDDSLELRHDSQDSLEIIS